MGLYAGRWGYVHVVLKVIEINKFCGGGDRHKVMNFIYYVRISNNIPSVGSITIVLAGSERTYMFVHFTMYSVH